jgi:hypothetical protein
MMLDEAVHPTTTGNIKQAAKLQISLEFMNTFPPLMRSSLDFPLL